MSEQIKYNNLEAKNWGNYCKLKLELNNSTMVMCTDTYIYDEDD